MGNASYDYAFLENLQSGGMNSYRSPGCSKERRIESKSDLNRSKPVDIQKAEAGRSECGNENGTGAYSVGSGTITWVAEGASKHNKETEIQANSRDRG
ncbi:hypothetical protein SNOG_14858 [Parastagonospora nodorum SN15]|uniref:Uncharacterized protein n=1 Tax=Phaeosphaeria nodorum (strain SN15 / ATCC MYA-4574 / FGSC 10173) TaxID=321614 RepID=Q0U003_PHANO|nr:hypothetical protein SNOG_14858 [Parastagonospora nodorum SN15]EAT77710.1 hypothetical protein SNOG_14858 [Parastagonospora nodorum SN15]